VKVLDRNLKRATRKGRFWPYMGDRHHRAAVFDLHADTRACRARKVFAKLIADIYKPTPMWLTTASSPIPKRGLVEVACWAHTRRHFHKALDTDSARMGAVLAYIAHLYKVEKTGAAARHRGRGLAPVARACLQASAGEVARVLEKIREEVLPKSEAGQAVAYALKNWTGVERATWKMATSRIDNNHTERKPARHRGVAHIT